MLSRFRIRTLALALGAAALLAIPALSLAGGDWNDSAVSWKKYDEGLAEAKSSNKPVCLIFYTDWCPHCANYSKVFHDPAVVDLSKKFVMIRINKDQDAANSAKFAPDGEYIPRTFFLKPDGTLLKDVTEQRDQYRYFYSETDPASVMRSMKTVLALTF
ncbi:MAG TPA: thioredoxin family protein [Candidatus Binatia bacterium]|jgi:thiol:disulfide interchange protein